MGKNTSEYYAEREAEKEAKASKKLTLDEFRDEHSGAPIDFTEMAIRMVDLIDPNSSPRAATLVAHAKICLAATDNVLELMQANDIELG